MKLLPKLSLFSVLLVVLTALTTITLSINTIKNILYDLNAQLVQRDLIEVQHFFQEEYKALEKHGLQGVSGYYLKVIQHAQMDFNGRNNRFGNSSLIVLDKNGKTILQSEASTNGPVFDLQLMRKQHNYMNETASSPVHRFEADKQIYFYKKIPEWNLGLYIVLAEKKLFAHLDEFIKEVITGLIIILFLALLLGFYFSHNLVSRLKEALMQIQSINNGDMTARIKTISGQDEINELKSGLNSMTEIIYEKMLLQARAELKSLQSQKSLKEQHALFSAFINAMPELAFILDESGEYIEIFGSNDELLYQQKELLMGENLNNILPEYVASEIMKTISKTLETQQTQTLEYELEIDGEIKYFLGNASVFDFSDRSKTDKRMVVWIANDITTQILAQREAHNLSLYDPLTELANRRLLSERLDQEIARAQRHEQFGALLFIDLDNFKIINDSCGHRIGDALLKETAQRLGSLLRKEDLACRLGGDEFVVMLSNLENNPLTASGQAQNIAHKILDMIQKPYELEDQQHQISCSIGVVLFPEGECNSHNLIKYADIAMYHAKDEGKNTVRIFSLHMQKLLENRIQLQNDLRQALKENGLTIHLQPQYNELGAITSAEALVRWEHPERGFISPAEFIPVAEESGLVHELGKSVMEMTLQALQRILKQALPPSFKRIAINVSPWQLGRNDYLDEVQGLLESYQIPAHYLEMEITEQTLVEKSLVFSEKIEKMQKMGIHFSIDDFGTGYSSLSYLKTLPVNMLKIDQTFIRDITIDKNDDAIVKTIIDMAKNLDLDVIAEGVETKEQLDFLRANGCMLYQGYYFSKPEPVDDFMNLLTGNT